mgnify:CR=1 FL=1
MPVVLVADDETYIRDLIRRALKNRPYTVLEATEGNETLEILKTHNVDLLILDLVMPKKGGIETFMETRESNRDIKIIVITGKINTEDDAVQGLTDQFGIDAVIAKPFDMKNLLHVIEELV